MAGKKTTVELTDEQAVEYMRALAIAKAEVRKLELSLKHYAATHGGFSAHGLHLYCTQTVKETYDPQIVCEALETLGVKWSDYVHDLPTTFINKVVRASEHGDDVRAYLKREPNEGMIVVYGKPLVAARTSAPDEAKVHILQPGDEPLTAAPLEKEEGGWDDEDGDYTEAPLSPGA